MDVKGKELIVDVTYRNERLEPVYHKSYTLDEYTEMLKFDLLRIVTDVEDMVYEMCDEKPKSQWDDQTWSAFCKVKHKLLDKAGDIGRLPENLRIDEQDGCDI